MLRDSRNCDGMPTTVEPLPGDQITTRPLETAPPLDELASHPEDYNYCRRCRPINRGAEHSYSSSRSEAYPQVPQV
jgi:hypothetical protein